MSMAPIRIAGSESPTIGNTSTVLRIRATEDRGLTYGILAIGGDADKFTVDWGDGSVTTINASGTGADRYAGYGVGSNDAFVHTYARVGEYRVTIDSNATWFSSASFQMDEEVAEYFTYAKLLEAVESWGTLMFNRPYTQFEYDYAMTGRSVFQGCENLARIANHKLSYILPYAFANCNSLTSPAPVIGENTNILESAFYNSPFTDTSWWPSSQKIVPEDCFDSCQFLSTVSMPYVTNVSAIAFLGCHSLSSIDLPSCTSVGDSAFEDCISLQSLDGLERAESFGDSCFLGCTSLTRMSSLDQCGVPLQNTEQNPLQALSVTSLGRGCFYGCTSITSLVSFPPSVSIIPEECFYGCTGLATEGINIPGQVTEIHTNAFMNVKASIIRFYEPPISCNSEIKREERHPELKRIDRGAFFGQAENGILYADISKNKIKTIPGADETGTIYDDNNPMIITWKIYGGTENEWFRSTSPSWAPWGIGDGWEIRVLNNAGTSYELLCSNKSCHTSIMCDDFVASPGVDWATEVSTRLDALYLASGKKVYINKNFSPYSDLKL